MVKPKWLWRSPHSTFVNAGDNVRIKVHLPGKITGYWRLAEMAGRAVICGGLARKSKRRILSKRLLLWR